MLVSDAGNRRGYVWGAGSIREVSVPSSQFCSKPIPALTEKQTNKPTNPLKKDRLGNCNNLVVK